VKERLFTSGAGGRIIRAVFGSLCSLERFDRFAASHLFFNVFGTTPDSSGVLTGKEMQALYRPNFCCECGGRVERARWRLWTSRRFCPACARNSRGKRFAAPLLFAAALAGVGFVCGRMLRPSPPPLVVERGTLNLAPVPAGDTPRRSGDARREDATPNREDAAKHEDAAAKPEPSYGPDGTANERPTDPEEVVYICGARTKKGTPCQRRVRGPFRCWQHRGMPAMLPPSKLVVQN
jgi:hypothetical protein